MTRKTLLALGLAAALIGGLGLRGQAQDAEPAAGHDMSMMGEGEMMPATQAFMMANEQMMKDMGDAFTNDPDVDFAHQMIPHHQGAIAMAKIELDYGKDPELRKLAEAIIAAQESEIAFLEKWLAAQ